MAWPHRAIAGDNTVAVFRLRLSEGMTKRVWKTSESGCRRLFSQSFVLIGYELLNVLHRFVGRCEGPFHPERYPANIRTIYPRRLF